MVMETFLRIRGIQQNIICGYERDQKVSTGLAVVNTAGDDYCTRCIIVTRGILYKYNKFYLKLSLLGILTSRSAVLKIQYQVIDFGMTRVQ